MKYAVLKGGSKLHGGFDGFQEAWVWANEHVRGMEAHRHSSKTPAPAFEIKPDTDYMHNENIIWRTCKRHTMVTKP